jgi:hypothetical protein
MANRQQHGGREAKKPKKDTGPAKPVTPLNPAPVTVVPDRRKKKT